MKTAALIFLQVVFWFTVGYYLECVLRWLRHRRHARVVRWNFHLFALSTNAGRTLHMAAVGDQFLATIAPTNAAGQPVGVGPHSFAVSPDGSYGLSPSADGLTCIYTALAPATSCVASVTGVTLAGNPIPAGSAALPDVVVPDTEAVTFGLTVAPIPKTGA